MNDLESRARALWLLAWRARRDRNWGRMLVARSALRRENPVRPKLRRLVAIDPPRDAAA